MAPGPAQLPTAPRSRRRVAFLRKGQGSPTLGTPKRCAVGPKRMGVKACQARLACQALEDSADVRTAQGYRTTWGGDVMAACHSSKVNVRVRFPVASRILLLECAVSKTGSRFPDTGCRAVQLELGGERGQSVRAAHHLAMVEVRVRIPVSAQSCQEASTIFDLTASPSQPALRRLGRLKPS